MSLAQSAALLGLLAIVMVVVSAEKSQSPYDVEAPITVSCDSNLSGEHGSNKTSYRSLQYPKSNAHDEFTSLHQKPLHILPPSRECSSDSFESSYLLTLLIHNLLNLNHPFFCEMSPSCAVQKPFSVVFDDDVSALVHHHLKGERHEKYCVSRVKFEFMLLGIRIRTGST